jgi:small subunit ribosomal protein S17|tara:strand:+ start:964 stop:1416 length:453 start_codon:yes stop_codon:yes gene_type:complete
MEAKNIGIQVKKPKKQCDDNNCPFHGKLRCRGRIFTCTVLSTSMQKTATVGWERRHFLRKYERYEKRKSVVKAHNPACLDAHDGNIVKIMECRPLSKTKNFVIVEVLGEEKGFKERIEAEEEAKFKEGKAKEEEGKIEEVKEKPEDKNED